MSRVPLALRRAIKLRVAPAMAEKEPATRILPSGCSVIAVTPALGAGEKEVSSVPSAAMRTRWLPVVPAGLVKLPPSRTRPSGWVTTARIVPVKRTEGAKAVRSEPSRLSQARPLPCVATGAVSERWRTAAIGPSASSDEAKVVSAAPSALKRATLVVRVPPMSANAPTATIFPSDCRAIAAMEPPDEPPVPGLNARSRVPLALMRT